MKKRLLDSPGVIKTMLRDMNDDGKDDLLVTSQGDESITVFYQRATLVFEAEQLLRFSPVYGTSWFDLLDYDGDGDLDIATVHGDKADESFVHKPYHGMRIHINEGTSGIRESFFSHFIGLPGWLPQILTGMGIWFSPCFRHSRIIQSSQTCFLPILRT